MSPRHLADNRDLKQNTVRTYYTFVSAWWGWSVNEGHLEAHYARRASATTLLPGGDGRKPDDQQAGTPELYRVLTEYYVQQARQLREEREDLVEELNDLRMQVDQIEADAVKAFNEYMNTLLEVLGYERIDRIWTEGRERDVRDGNRTIVQMTFELHISGAGRAVSPTRTPTTTSVK